MNKLKVNPDKMLEVLLMSVYLYKVALFMPVPDGVALPLKAYICSLGALLDLGQLLDVQMVGLARSVFYQLHGPFWKSVISPSYPFLGHI